MRRYMGHDLVLSYVNKFVIYEKVDMVLLIIYMCDFVGAHLACYSLVRTKKRLQLIENNMTDLNFS